MSDAEAVDLLEGASQGAQNRDLQRGHRHRGFWAKWAAEKVPSVQGAANQMPPTPGAEVETVELGEALGSKIL